MNLTPLTAGKIAGTGTVQLQGSHEEGGLFGGALLTADGTNACVVVIRKDNSSGEILFDVSSKTPFFATAPIRVDGTKTLYYSITGTNASAMLYEWNA